MKKIIISLIFLIIYGILLFTLTGCGNDEPAYDEDTSYNEETAIQEQMELKIGDYINYPIEYSNATIIYNSKEHTAYNKGWRVLSIEESENGKQIIQIVSAGIPLTYFHPATEGSATIGVKIITTDFFNPDISKSSETTAYQINYIGFKDASSLQELKELFKNEYTQLDENNMPMVRSMTKEDVDKLLGKTTQTGDFIDSTDLLVAECIECEDIENSMYADKYVDYWLATEVNSQVLWKVTKSGYLYDYSGFGKLGIRTVVTLKSDVKFTQNSINEEDITIWDISI